MAEIIEDEVGSVFNADAKKQHDKQVKNLKNSNMRAVFGGGAGRIALIVVVVCFLAVFVIGASKLFGGRNDGGQQSVQANIPTGPTQSANAFAADQSEAEMRAAANQEHAAAAAAAGQPYIAAPVINPTESNSGVPAPVTAQGPALSAEEQRRKLAEEAARQPENQASVDPSLVAAAAQRNAEIKAYLDYREKIKSDLVTQSMVQAGMGWKGERLPVISTGAYAVPDRSKQQAAQAQVVAAQAENETSGATVKTKLFDAGDGCYGSFSWTTNTDTGRKEMMVSVPLCKGYRNLKVIGKYEQQGQAKQVNYSFDKLSIPGKGTFPIQAIAINQDSWDAGFADDVDNHYFRRFGSIAVAAFAQGIGQAASMQTGTVQTTPVSSTVSTQPMSSERELKIALGTTGQQIGQVIQQENAGLKPTVKVYGSQELPMRGVGIVFLSDVFEEKK